MRGCLLPQDLTYGDGGHNWRSIIFSLLVIGFVIAGIVTAIYLLGWVYRDICLRSYLSIFLLSRISATCSLTLPPFGHDIHRAGGNGRGALSSYKVTERRMKVAALNGNRKRHDNYTQWRNCRYVDELLYWSGRRLTLDECLRDDLTPHRLPPTWISHEKFVYQADDGSLSLLNTSNNTVTLLVSNHTLVRIHA